MTGLRHKGYRAVLDYDPDRGILRGTVPGLTGLRFEARALDDVPAAFEAAVDAYLAAHEGDGAMPAPPSISPFGELDAIDGEEALLRDLYYGSEFAIFLIDVDAGAPEAERFRFAGINPAYERITGISADEMVGYAPADLAHIFTAEGVAAVQANYQRCLDAGETISYEEPLTVQGRDTWWLTSLTPLRGTDGHLFRIVGSAIEITEQKTTQHALIEARDRAQAADRAKSAFLATMSHELRTPLNGIIGFADLLRTCDLNVEAEEFVTYIQQSGETLLALIGDLLDFSKIEANEMTLIEEPMSVKELVEASLQTITAQAAGKGIDLGYRIASSVPSFLRGDPLRFKQILLNLLSNALKFTAAGAVVVEAEAERVGDDEYEVHVSVRDTGIGIPEDVQLNLFEPFFQVDASNTRAYGGTGLGLAICRRLTALMGGGIWVDSRAGEGSTFHFTAVLQAETVLQPMPMRTSETDLAGRTVLIVDDLAINRRLLRLSLEEWDMVVTAAETGAEALELLERESFDVALLDVQMPGMDGVALARRIRARFPEDALPLVFLSSADQRLDEARALAGAVLNKPILFDRLRDVLGALVPGVRPADAARDAEPDAPPTLAPADVLVVEDQPTNLRVTLAMLRRLGVASDVAHDGQEALDALARHPYQLVLMDVRMPNMNGLDATRRIREMREGDGPYIIALTAQAMQGDREACLAAGMNDYVSKPLRMPDLHAALQRYREATAR